MLGTEKCYDKVIMIIIRRMITLWFLQSGIEETIKRKREGRKKDFMILPNSLWREWEREMRKKQNERENKEVRGYRDILSKPPMVPQLRYNTINLHSDLSFIIFIPLFFLWIHACVFIMQNTCHFFIQSIELQEHIIWGGTANLWGNQS